MDAFGAVLGAHAEDDRAGLQLHRVEVIDDFEVSAGERLLHFFNFGFNVVDQPLHFYFLRDFFHGPVDTCHIRAVVEVLPVAQKRGDSKGVLRIDQQ